MSLFRRSSRDGDSRWIVVGLGNPGEKYSETRHNMGAMVIDVLLGRASASLKSHKSGCLIAETNVAGEKTVLARPTTYMNDSGRPVRELARWYKAEPEHLVVIHDELDIGFDEVRIKDGGGTAGHNGLGSIASHLGTRDFVRVRVGIGRPKGRGGAVGHVLNGFSKEERKELPFVLERAADAVESIIGEGIEKAMNHFNTKA
jgi:PTH1 family peptidyl-tRNA hydrolase